MRALLAIAIALAACSRRADTIPCRDVGDCPGGWLCQACTGAGCRGSYCQVNAFPLEVNIDPTLLAAGAVYLASARVTDVASPDKVTYAWTIEGGALPADARGREISFAAGAGPSVSLTCKARLGELARTVTVTRPVAAVVVRPEIETKAFVLSGETGVEASVRNPVQDMTYQWSIEGPGLLRDSAAAHTLFDVLGGGQISLRVLATNQAGDAVTARVLVQAVSAPPSRAPAIEVQPDFLLAKAAGNARVVEGISGVTYHWAISGGALTSPADGPHEVNFTASAGGAPVVLTCTASNFATPASASVATGDTGMMLLAGAPGGRGHRDGSGARVRLDEPFQLAADGQGGAWFLEGGTPAVRHVDSTGAVTPVAGAAESGPDDGVGASARFQSPAAIAATPDAGTLFVADARGLRKLSQVGGAWQVSTVFPSFVASGLAAVDANTVYAIRPGLGAVVRAFSNDGSSWSESQLPLAGGASLDPPACLGMFGAGTLFVAGGGLRMLEQSGATWNVTLLLDAGKLGPSNVGCQIVATDRTHVLVSDPARQAIAGATLTSSWELNPYARLARGFADGKPDKASDPLNAALFPVGLAPAGADAMAGVLVADRFNHAIRKIVPAATPEGAWVTTLAGRPRHAESADGAFPRGRVSGPMALARVGCDLEVSALDGVRRLTGAALSTDYGGQPGCAGHSPALGLSAIDAGHFLFATALDQCQEVVSFSNETGPFLPGLTVGGEPGFTDSKIGAPRFRSPASIDVSSGGVAYVADFGNDALRAIDLTVKPWAVSTLPGYQGATGQHAVALGDDNHLFVATAQRVFVWKNLQLPLLSSGEPIAGPEDSKPGGYQNGPGNKALFAFTPWNGAWPMLAAARPDLVYAADPGNHAVRKIAKDAGGNWQVTTVAGGQGRGAITGADPALNTPLGLAVLCDGRLAITDAEEDAVFVLAE